MTGMALIRTIVLCVCVGGAVVSLLACAPTPAAKTVGLILNEPEAFDGYTLFSLRQSKTIYLIDNSGRMVHRWDLDADALFARLLENGNLLTFANLDTVRAVREIDSNENILQECSQGFPHHDFLKMPNGNVMMLSRQHKTAEEAIAAGADPDFVSADGLRVPHIVEARPTGPASCEIVWEWSVWDHLIQDFDSSKANYGVVAEHPELIDLNVRPPELPKRQGEYHVGMVYDPRYWIRGNGIDYNPELDQVMLSARFFGEVWIIDHSTTTSEAAGHSGGKGGKGGDLLYRWGNPRAWRAGTPEDQQLFRPHNSQWIAPACRAPETSSFSTMAARPRSSCVVIRRWMRSPRRWTGPTIVWIPTRLMLRQNRYGFMPQKGLVISSPHTYQERNGFPTETR